MIKANASALQRLNLNVFPCNADKSPRCKGHWLEYKGPVDANVFGIPVPSGLIIVDLDSHKAGFKLEDVERSLGCQPGDINWTDADLQSTMNGGKHYCFQAPQGLRQGSNLFGVTGFDTRCAGKGYIASGKGYKQTGAGVTRLAYPGTFPPLPLSAQHALTAHDLHKPNADERAVSPPRRISYERARAMLKSIPPTCDRDTWMRVGLSLRASMLPFELYDEWSRGDLHGGEQPHNYTTPSHTEGQYKSFKPDGKIGPDTLPFIARENGYKEDWSAVFANSGDDSELKDICNEIAESGSDPTKVMAIIESINATPLSSVERHLAMNTLRIALKDAELLTRELSKAISDSVKDPKPVESKHPTPPPSEYPDMLTFEELIHSGITLPAASTNHGANAVLLLTDVFQSRMKLDNGRYRWWDGSHWALVQEDAIKSLLWRFLMPDHALAHIVSGTMTALAYLTPALPAPRNPRAIYFKNGAFDPERGTWHMHERQNYNTSRLEVDYNPEAQAPKFTEFVNQIFGGLEDGEDRVAMLQEIIGYTLIDDTLNLQAAIALDGASRGGKGLILEVITALRGEDMVGAISFDDMADPKQQNTLLDYRLIIDTDAKSPRGRDQKEVSGFFNKITANERVGIKQHYSHTTVRTRTHTKMLVACNGIPQLIDDSGATSNRWVTLQFCKSFLGREDRTLCSRITAPEELEGIAAWAISGLQRLIANHVRFTTPESSQDAIESLRDVNQPFKEFVNEIMIFEEGAKCHGHDIYDNFRAWAAESGSAAPPRQQFSRSMKQMLMAMPNVSHRRNLKIDGLNKAGFIGCRMAGRFKNAFS